MCACECVYVIKRLETTNDKILSNISIGGEIHHFIELCIHKPSFGHYLCKPSIHFTMREIERLGREREKEVEER